MTTEYGEYEESVRRVQQTHCGYCHAEPGEWCNTVSAEPINPVDSHEMRFDRMNYVWRHELYEENQVQRTAIELYARRITVIRQTLDDPNPLLKITLVDKETS
jgi:hypothetical protein